MGRWVSHADLRIFADIPLDQATALIEQAEALAVTVAPCLTDLTEPAKEAVVRGILVAAILRWDQTGAGGVTQSTAGPFSETIDPRSRRGLFWPSEVRQLQRLCRGTAGRAFMIDLAQPTGGGGPYASPIHDGFQ